MSKLIVLFFHSNSSSHQRLSEAAFFTRLVGYKDWISNQARYYSSVHLPNAVQIKLSYADQTGGFWKQRSCVSERRAYNGTSCKSNRAQTYSFYDTVSRLLFSQMFDNLSTRSGAVFRRRRSHANQPRFNVLEELYNVQKQQKCRPNPQWTGALCRMEVLEPSRNMASTTACRSSFPNTTTVKTAITWVHSICLLLRPFSRIILLTSPCSSRTFSCWPRYCVYLNQDGH